MGAVRMLAGVDLRRRWGSLLSLALLVGLVGTLTFAIAAGARRSSTALERFKAYSRSTDLEIDSSGADPKKVAQFSQLPGVRSLAQLRVYAAPIENQRDLTLLGRMPGGADTDRELVVRGRLANSDAADEITISESLAQQRNLRIGDELHATFFSEEQIARAQRGNELGKPKGAQVSFRIVGITRRPLDLGDRSATGGIVIATPGFVRAHPREFAYVDLYSVRTRNPNVDVARLTAAAKQYFPQDGSFQAIDLRRESSGAGSAIDVITTALWIFAVVSAIAGGIVLTIVLTRDVSRLRTDESTWRGLGLTHSQRTAVAMPRVLLIAGIGVVLSFVGAALCSPFLPVGIARRADPNHGFHVDWVALGGGAAVLAVFVVGISALAAFRASRNVARTPVSSRTALTGFRGGSPTLANGLRLALQSGRGDHAVPVRSAFIGVAVGVIGVVALGTFAGSLDHVAATPRLYGQTFDFRLAQPYKPPPCRNTNPALDKDRSIEAIALLCYQPIQFDGRQITTWSLRSHRGAIAPEMLSGRAPTAADEVALGAETLSTLHKRIGDTVRATVAGQRSDRTYRIVGVAVFPRVRGEDIQALSDGAFVSAEGMAPFLPAPSDDASTVNNISELIVGRFAPGVDHQQAARRITAMPVFIPPNADVASFNFEPGAKLATPPPEVERLRKIDWFPPTLTVVLGTLALIAVAHTIVTSTRRRRRDLAMLKTLGFTRGQVRATIAWQATVIALIGLVVGVPLGILLGRFAWTRIADSLGINVVIAVPVLVVLGVAAAAVVLVNVVAFFPARAAARMRPAVALAAE